MQINKNIKAYIYIIEVHRLNKLTLQVRIIKVDILCLHGGQCCTFYHFKNNLWFIGLFKKLELR